MELIFIKEVELEPDTQMFTQILNRLSLVHKKIPQSQVELLLTGDARLQELNKAYRGKDRPTDVLSFPLDDPQNLGQIVISLDRAKAQAKELGQSTEEELRFLFAHGVLHLLGYDHHDPEEEKVMVAKTYQLLNR